MSKKVKKLDADVVIAGGGPGGCEIARHFARKGKKVVLLEKGGYDTRFRGHTLGLLLHQERALNRHVTRGTQEGDILGLGIGVGGGTLAMVGSAFLPDADYWKKYGIDIMEHLDEAVEECKVQKVPKGFIGPGTKRIMEAAQELGYPWEPVYKYLDLAKHKRGCMDCYKMCPRGAKWTAKVSADEAVSNGATILTHVTVRDVIVEDGTAGGVKAIGRRGQRYEISAKVVVCSAGAVGTAPILKRAGLHDAGSWLAGDPTVISFGFVSEGSGGKSEIPMSTGFRDKEHGVVFVSYLSTRMIWALLVLAEGNFGALRHLHRYGKALGVLCKVTDEMEGRVFADGKATKTYTARDLWRLDYGRVTNERILIKAGCDPYNIYHGRPTLGHPSATAGVGKLVDSDLQTEIKNLYCCDTSVFPEAPAIPPALTVTILGKRLARHLETIL